VDADGNDINKNDSYQADICEMIRALIFNDKIKAKTTENMNNLSNSFIDFINCVGDSENGNGFMKVK